jgi:hypothetical protein
VVRKLLVHFLFVELKVAASSRRPTRRQMHGGAKEALLHIHRGGYPTSGVVSGLTSELAVYQHEVGSVLHADEVTD